MIIRLRHLWEPFDNILNAGIWLQLLWEPVSISTQTQLQLADLSLEAPQCTGNTSTKEAGSSSKYNNSGKSRKASCRSYQSESSLSVSVKQKQTRTSGSSINNKMLFRWRLLTMHTLMEVDLFASVLVRLLPPFPSEQINITFLWSSHYLQALHAC